MLTNIDKLTLKKTERAITNGQSRETGQATLDTMKQDRLHWTQCTERSQK
jgi:hypothetical protein